METFLTLRARADACRAVSAVHDLATRTISLRKRRMVYSNANAGGRSAGIAGELEQHRMYLMRLARLELRDDTLAQDVVQETMLAALSTNSFSGGSTLRTWLTSILKHKIIDAIRKRQRRKEVAVSEVEEMADAGGDDFDSPFDDHGAWHTKPSAWADPEQSLKQRQFMEVLSLCMERLPAQTARVFVMREYLELDVTEIGEELKITSTHIYVLLYRARATLRACLEKKWFGDEPARRTARKSP